MAMEVIYIGTSTLTKLSILFFYRRITSSVLSRSLMVAIWASIIFGTGSLLLVTAHGMLTPSLRSRSVWTRMYPRSHLHLLAGGSILVPLYDVVAAHSQVQVRR
jgi:hypothetical protein